MCVCVESIISKRLDTVEVFDFKSGRWETLPQRMNTKRRDLKVAVHQGKLYAVGGYDGRFLKTAESLLVSRPTQE